MPPFITHHLITGAGVGGQILEKGGILAIDDYVYNKDDENILNSPYNDVNHFLKLYKGQYNILSISYRVFLEKI